MSEMPQEVLKVMSMPGKLVLSKQGYWLHDNTKVSNKKISSYFFKHLTFNSEINSYVIAVDGKCVEVEIEDVAFFVTKMDLDTNICFTINGFQELSLKSPEISISKDNIFYLKIDESKLARFTRSTSSGLHNFVEKIKKDYYFKFNNINTKIGLL